MININELIKNSLKSGNKTELKAYRNLKAEFLKVKTSKGYKGEWTDELEINTIAKYGRQLDAAIAEFGGPQTTLGHEYSDELEVIKKLLPAPIEPEDIEYRLYNWADELNFMDYSGEGLPRITIPKKEIGNAIKHMKSRFPTADGKMISEIVKKYLV